MVRIRGCRHVCGFCKSSSVMPSRKARTLARCSSPRFDLDPLGKKQLLQAHQRIHGRILAFEIRMDDFVDSFSDTNFGASSIIGLHMKADDFGWKAGMLLHEFRERQILDSIPCQGRLRYRLPWAF